MYFLWQNTEIRSPKLRFIAHNKCIGLILPSFISSSLNHNWFINASSNALKPNKSIHQYVTMATADSICIFFCAWFGSACLHLTITCHKIKLERKVMLSGRPPLKVKTQCSILITPVRTRYIGLNLKFQPNFNSIKDELLFTSFKMNASTTLIQAFAISIVGA